MKTTKEAEALVDANRIANSVPVTEFWKELEERMAIREASETDLVKPRSIKE